MKKKRYAPGVIVLAIGLAAIASIIIYTARRYAAMPDNFYDNRKTSAEKLYNEVVSVDLENAYPETPEDVIKLNNKILQLYYGKMVKNNELIEELVRIQRKLFDEAILENTSEDDQVEALLKAIDELYSNDVYVYRVEQGVTYYSVNSVSCIIPVTQTVVNYDNLFWNYLLRIDAGGRWKIYAYPRTDENFRIIE